MVDISESVRVFGQRIRSLIGKNKGKEQVDMLGIISTAVHHGCMGLPQELVDHVMDMLHNDIPTLKACSLTCKAMFASTRRLIHRTLCLTLQNSKSVLNGGKKFRDRYGRNQPALDFRFVACMSERGLLRYTRQVYFSVPYYFTPYMLMPYLHYFRLLDKVHTLIVERYSLEIWSTHCKTCFTYFYPTLTSLTLRHPYCPYQLLLQFALQFPHLENLCLEWLYELGQDRDAHAIIDRFPPLRGHLRLIGVKTVAEWPMDIVHGLRDGMNFRSVELEYFLGDQAQDLLNACARTLESLTIRPRVYKTGYIELQNLGFVELIVLRRVAFQTVLLNQVHASVLDSLLRALSTIRSPVFREFVLELGGNPDMFGGLPSSYWGCWKKIERFLEEQFAMHHDFRFIIRRNQFHDREIAEETFPLLASKQRIRFEHLHG